MCGFIAQLVEHRTGIAEVTGSNPVEALIFFSGFFFPIAQIGKFTAMITFHLQSGVLYLTSHIQGDSVHRKHKQDRKYKIFLDELLILST